MSGDARKPNSHPHFKIVMKLSESSRSCRETQATGTFWILGAIAHTSHLRRLWELSVIAIFKTRVTFLSHK